MHHIRARDIPMSLRRPHVARYISQLRKALADPSLAGRERERLQARLDRLTRAIREYAGG